MICPGEAQRTGIVLRRTIRGVLCLAGIVWLLIFQSPLANDRFSAATADSCALAYAAATEVFQTGDDFGAALEDSVEILRFDRHEFSAPVDPLAASKAPATSVTRRCPELSPPLLV